MKYINITTRHHDGFCLWDTKYSDFKSTNSPAKRDLVAELSEQCNKKGLALFLYYSHGRDWKHPHAPNNDEWKGAARPSYKPNDPTYKYGELEQRGHGLIYFQTGHRWMTVLIFISIIAFGCQTYDVDQPRRIKNVHFNIWDFGLTWLTGPPSSTEPDDSMVGAVAGAAFFAGLQCH